MGETAASLVNAKEFREIIVLTIDRSRLLLGTKRFAFRQIVSLVHTRNRIAMFMDPTQWRHRKLPPWKTLPVAGDSGLAGGATPTPTSRDVTNQAGYVAEKRCHDDDR